ncbi:DUF4406 domain-containing protein [Fusobacterium sp.]|uniref:DUF4406 domain-containing protein n=1 Tax=Fusobacterium sp. TaxID=68766 RepID=UPI0025BCB620|nr:DUF4406 domain-containing protein [Fusobacterium sp.]MCI7223297.1 hypothetical protein [Fusobacterium sp.]
MKLIKIYVAHPYEAREENKKKVEEFINKYKDNKQVVFMSPIHSFGWRYNSTDYEKGINECLALLEGCDIIIMPKFDEIVNSKGCLIEYGFAKGKGIKMVDYDGFNKFLNDIITLEKLLEIPSVAGGF